MSILLLHEVCLCTVYVSLRKSKLQSDLKTTKFDEAKIALEVCYNEIQRLRSEKLTSASPRLVSELSLLHVLH